MSAETLVRCPTCGHHTSDPRCVVCGTTLAQPTPAVDSLVAAVRNPDVSGSVRVAAAEAILEKAFGKPGPEAPVKKRGKRS